MLEFILIAIGIWLLLRLFSSSSKAGPREKNVPGVKKKDQKEFWRYMANATTEYGNIAIGCMDNVIRGYAQGKGVEKDPEKAKQWKERQIRQQLEVKTYVTDYGGFSGYVADLDFFLDGEYIAPDIDKAYEMAILLYSKGTDGAGDLLKKIQSKRNPSDTRSAKEIYADHVTMQYGMRDRSQKIYAELCEEMSAEGIHETADVVRFLLKKAQWKIPAETAVFPGASKEQEAAFNAARAIEAAGQDFAKAAQAYEPLAQSGHSEAMRRMGLIKRDILNTCFGSKEYYAGLELIERSAAAGNALAQFDLGQEQLNVGMLVGLAEQKNLDAMYALGCLVEQGRGGPENWGVAQAFFRYMMTLIGDPVARKDGEGIEWLRKLGEKLYMMEDAYMLELADVGVRIGYAPSYMALLTMTDELMRRAYAKSDDKAGAYGDFGFHAYMKELAKTAEKAGYARAKAIREFCSLQEIGYDSYKHKQLTDAEQGTGDWSYFNNLSARERVAKATASLSRDIRTAFASRMQKGLNFYRISDQVRNENSSDIRAESILEKLPKESTGRAKKTLQASELPHYIRDELGRTWARSDTRPGLFAEISVYCLENYEKGDYWDNGRTVEIHNYHIEGNKARTLYHTFTW